MRRALAGVVPDAILHRRRKGYVNRSVLVSIATDYDALLQLTTTMASAAAGIVDDEAFRRVLADARYGKDVPLVPLIRTFVLESWLRHISQWGTRLGHAIVPLAAACKGVQLADCPLNPLMGRR